MRPAICAAVAALLGCSSGSLTGGRDGGPDGGLGGEVQAVPDGDLPPVTDADISTPAAFCAAWMDLRAKAYDGCGQWLGIFDKRTGPQTYGCGRFVASVTAGRVSWDAAAAAVCLQSYGWHECAAGIWTGCAGTTPEVELGGACSPYAFAPECKGDAFCMPDALGACTGRCTARRAQGDACSASGDCASPLGCDPTGHCSGPAAGACGTTATGFVCEDLLTYCAPTDAAAGPTGTCQPKRTDGPCTPGGNECVQRCVGAPGQGQCQAMNDFSDTCVPGGHNCYTGAYCSLAGHCAGPAPLGASCAPVSGEAVSCAWGSVCDPSTRTCIAPIKPGQPCSDTSGDDVCGWDASARCDSGAAKACAICQE